MEKIPMTQQGYNRLLAEHETLKVESRSVIEAIAEARGHGDLSENAEYHAARERQSFIVGRMAELNYKITHAEIIDIAKLSSSVVIFGATVEIVDEDTDEVHLYQIVGADESDVKRKLISILSPLARALIGKKVGDSITVLTPKGEKNYTLEKLSFEVEAKL